MQMLTADSKPKILVTGAAGFIGSHLVPRLLETGHAVSCPVRDGAASSESSRRRLADLEKLQAQYRDKLQLARTPDASAVSQAVQLAKPEICVHLAGRSWVRESVALPELYAEANYGATVALLKALCQSGCRRVVFASTMVVYGKDAPLPYSEGSLGSAPASPYGASKLACEVLLNMYHALGKLETVNLRLFSAYGPDLRPDLVPHLIASAILQGKPFTLFGDGSSVRDYIEIRDVLEAIVAACQAKESYAALNIGSGVGTTLLELIELLQKHLGRKAELVYKPPVQGELRAAVPDISLAREKLKWEPRVGIDEGMARLAEWFTIQARKDTALPRKPKCV